MIAGSVSSQNGKQKSPGCAKALLITQIPITSIFFL
jgi:hypothetical protein